MFQTSSIKIEADKYIQDNTKRSETAVQGHFNGN